MPVKRAEPHLIPPRPWTCPPGFRTFPPGFRTFPPGFRTFPPGFRACPSGFRACPSGFRNKPAAVFMAALALWAVLLLAGPDPALAETWRTMEPGLEMAEFDPPGRPDGYAIAVARIDPAVMDLRLLAAARDNVPPMPVDDWADSFDLTAVINASMYLREDKTKSTGYMRDHDYVNNRVLNARFGAFLVFNPLNQDLPEVDMVDRDDAGWRKTIKGYATVIQNYRMIGPGRTNAWKPGGAANSVACVAMDGAGRVLFILSREPYPVHDFIDALLGLPLDVQKAMYVEGGPEASLYLRSGFHTEGWVGSYRRGSFLADSNRIFWDLANVIGAVRKKAPAIGPAKAGQ